MNIFKISIKFYLNNGKNENRTIFCHIRSGTTRFTLHTGESILKRYWNTTKGRAKNSYIGAQELNLYLDKFKYEIEKHKRNYAIETDLPSFKGFKDYLKKKLDSKSELIIEQFQKFIDNRRKKLSDNRIKTLSAVLNLLNEYQIANKVILTYKSIDNKFNQDFSNFLLNKKYNNNSINLKLTIFTTFLKWSQKNGLSINNVNFEKPKSYQSTLIALTKEEVDRIINLKLEDKLLSQIKDFFIFAIFTGARYSDLAKISWEEIQGTNWNMTTQKTTSQVIIPLLPTAIDILNKRSKEETPLIRISNANLNIGIKKICKLAGINESIQIFTKTGNKQTNITKQKYQVISIHTARRTFITISILLGMPQEIIQKITGHKTYAMLNKYVKVSSKETESFLNESWNQSL